MEGGWRVGGRVGGGWLEGGRWVEWRVDGGLGGGWCGCKFK